MLIHESLRVIESKVTDAASGRYRVRLISEGQGSSGYYAGEMLAKYLPEALPAKSHIYLDHKDHNDEEQRGGNRTIRDIIGYIESTPSFNSEDKSMEADVVFIPSVREDIDVLMKVVGLSIEIYEGEIEEDGNVKELGAHPLNSVALVPVPGRDGRILSKVAESFQENKDNENMEITQEQMDAIAAQVVAALEAKAQERADAAAAAQAAQAAEDADADKPSALEMAKTLAVSGLTEKQMEHVTKAVESGEVLDDAIKNLKEILEDTAQVATGVFASEGDAGKYKSNEDYFQSLVAGK